MQRHRNRDGARHRDKSVTIAQRVLACVRTRGSCPGYLLVADRNNNRALIISPAKKVVWAPTASAAPTTPSSRPGYRSDHHERGVQRHADRGLAAHEAALWHYGHAGVPGSSPGYLNTPDDAYRLPNGDTTVADIQNCRDRLAPPRGRRRAHPRRELRARPAARLREPERRHAAPRRRPARHRDRRLDRPPRARRPPRLVDALAGRVPLRRAVAARTGACSSPRFTIPGRIVSVDRFGHVTGRSARRAGPIGSTSPRSRCACRTA